MSTLNQKKCPQCGYETSNPQFVYCPCCESGKVKLIDAIHDPSQAKHANAKSDYLESSDTDSHKSGMINKDTGASVGMGGVNTGEITSIDNSKTTIINHSTPKTHVEILVESRKVYRQRCKNLFHDGFITDDGLKELEELRCSIDLDATIATAIRDEVKTLSVKVRTELPPAGKIKLENLHIAIMQNNTELITSIIPELEGWMKRVRSSELSSIYYQLNAILYPAKYIKILLENTAEDYWKTYWSYIAYSLQGLNAKAESALAELTAWDGFYPQQNQVLLLVIGYIMSNDIVSARLAYSRLSTGISNELASIKYALSELMETDYSVKNIVNLSGNTSFYAHNLFPKFIEEIERKLKENKAKQIEEEATEQRLLNQIRFQKESVLQKFQETCHIEKACREVGVAYHTFNVWLEEDSTFASSYNELVHSVEVRKYEEAERKRKEQVIEMETKQKKSQFKILFEQNKCDLLKTCSELGISSADYQEWRRLDSVFNDDINYIIRENQKVINQQYRQKRAKIIKKVSLIIGALTILLVLVLGIKTIIDNINATKAAEEARIEQEAIQKRELQNQYISLISSFNDILDNIDKTKYSSTPNVEEFNSALTRLEEKLKEIRCFESSNPSIPNPQYSILRQKCIDMCSGLIKPLKDRATTITNPDDSKVLFDMILSIESLTSRL